MVSVMWTIYDHPRDYPEGYIARRWDVEASRVLATDIVLRSDSLELLREQMEDMELFCIPRSESDEPQVLETWI